MPLNFPDSPNNGDTYQGYTYNSTVGAWAPAAADTSGVTVYATVDDLPATGTAGDQAFVTASNRLYLWNGSGWYNIALINTTPTISGVSASYELAADGTPTVVTITATDPEGLPITYNIASDTSGNIATVAQGTGANTNVFTITPSTNNADGGTFSLTFRASDGVNIASAISEFTLAFAVQNSKYTTALITSVGTNNQVNNDFVDSSTNSHTITATGNATQTTFSPYRHGGYSTYFDGAGDYLNFNGSSINIGTGDFTIEAYVYHTGSSDNTILSTTGCTFTYGVNGQLRFYTGTGSNLTDSGTAFISGRWVHIAAVRTSGVLKMFQDGTEVYSGAYTHNIASFTSASIGVYHVSAVAYYKGYITDLRVVVGSALYTSNYTPPTERLTAITNTSLLTCHLPYIADGSTNGHSITVNGNAHTEPFAPYDYQTYSASENLGSMYFDGNGDYVKVTNTTTSVSGDFTIECWLNFNSYRTSGANSRVFCMKPGGNAADNLQLIVDMGTPGVAGSISVWTNAYSAQASTPIDDDSWHHIAITRESGTIKIYIDGTLEGSGSNSTTFDFSGHKIGTRDETADTTSKFTGSIADFRTVVGTAVYTSNFTPPTAPLTDITNTLALVRGTNAGIIDKSQSVKTLTLNGDVKSSTTQTKYLSSSMYFDGTGDYIDLPDFVSDWGSKDFTVEVWIYPTAVGTRYNFGDFNSAGQNASSSLVFKFENDKAKWWIQTTTYNSIISAASISANAWTHIALVRNGSTITQYINGNSDGTFNVGSASINQSSIVYTLGTGGDYQADFYQGYMSDFRVTKGLARYTANFTPPTAALEG